MTQDSRRIHLLIFFLLNLSVGFGVYLFRGLDSNTLTNWRWIGEWSGPWKVYALFFVSSVVALTGFFTAALSERLLLSITIVLAAGAVYLLADIPQVIVDASRYFLQAKYLLIHGIKQFLVQWGKDVPAWTDLPLIPLLYGLAFRTLGEGPLAVVLLNCAFFLVTVYSTYRLGTILWGRKTGVYAGALMLAMQYLLVQIPLMMVDVGTMAFFILSVYLLVRFLKEGTVDVALVTVFCILMALLSKYSAWLFALIYPVAVLVFSLNRRDRTEVLKRALCLFTVTALTFIAVIFIYKDTVLEQLKLLMGFQRQGLASWYELSLSTVFFQIHPFIAGFALMALAVAYRRRDITVLLPFTAVVMLLLIHRSRYIIPLLPMLALLAAYGMQWIRHRQVRQFVLFCCVLSSLSVALWLYSPFLKNISLVNLKEAAIFLNNSGCRSVRIVCLPQRLSAGNTAAFVGIFDLYYNGQILSVQGWEVKTEIEYHPLFFTWMLKKPDFYLSEGRSVDAEVVIGSDLSGSEGADLEFSTMTGIFRYRSILWIRNMRCAERHRSSVYMSTLAQSPA